MYIYDGKYSNFCLLLWLNFYLHFYGIWYICIIKYLLIERLKSIDCRNGRKCKRIKIFEEFFINISTSFTEVPLQHGTEEAEEDQSRTRSREAS